MSIGVIVVSRPLLETMQDNEIILGYRALELHALSGILLRYSGEIFDESLLAVWHSGVVLNVEFAHMPLVKIFLLLITSLGSFPISVFYRLI